MGLRPQAQLKIKYPCYHTLVVPHVLAKIRCGKVCTLFEGNKVRGKMRS